MRHDYQSIQLLREAGAITRFHTMRRLLPHVLAEHLWNAAILAFAIDPEIRAEVIMAVLLHDAEEIETGDTPAQVKWRNPDLASTLARIERTFRGRMDIDFHLSPGERQVLNAADRLEIILTSLDEVRMGNSSFWVVLDRLKAAPLPTEHLREDIAGRFLVLQSQIWAEVARVRGTPDVQVTERLQA